MIADLQAVAGAQVRVALKIDAETPAAAPDAVVRSVTKNSRTLKFSDPGVEAQ